MDLGQGGAHDAIGTDQATKKTPPCAQRRGGSNARSCFANGTGPACPAREMAGNIRRRAVTTDWAHAAAPGACLSGAGTPLRRSQTVGSAYPRPNHRGFAKGRDQAGSKDASNRGHRAHPRMARHPPPSGRIRQARRLRRQTLRLAVRSGPSDNRHSLVGAALLWVEESDARGGEWLVRRPGAARSTRVNHPRKALSKSSTRYKPSAKPAKLISGARRARVGG